MVFGVAKVKYVKFLHRLIKHTAAAHEYASLRHSRFILGAISVLGHMVFIRFHFEKRNEKKN